MCVCVNTWQSGVVVSLCNSMVDACVPCRRVVVCVLVWSWHDSGAVLDIDATLTEDRLTTLALDIVQRRCIGAAAAKLEAEAWEIDDRAMASTAHHIHRDPNAFSVTLYCVDEQFESRHLDFLRHGAFVCSDAFVEADLVSSACHRSYSCRQTHFDRLTHFSVVSVSGCGVGVVSAE